MTSRRKRTIVSAVRAELEQAPGCVVAVSGGVDSMVLLDAVARTHGNRHIVVATFDHGTGRAARNAVTFVKGEAARRGFPVRIGRAALAGESEATWRRARWEFLRTVAQEERARIFTGHTRDDQIETVVMRILRGAGVRGLAGLFAPSDVARPLLGHSRAEICRYASRESVAFVEDPSNRSRAYLRNRIRHEFLPALRATQPGFDLWVLDLAQRAQEVRHDLDVLARELIGVPSAAELLCVNADCFDGMGDADRRLLWQSFAGLAGVRLDWRGTTRLARFSFTSRPGQSVQLSGGLEVIRSATRYVVRPASQLLTSAPRRLTPDLSFGAWHFRRLDQGSVKERSASPWMAAFPANAEPMVRSWMPGDRMAGGEDRAKTKGGSRSGRRVARFFADAGIAGPLRRGWPVVLMEGKVVWIPGVSTRFLGNSEAGTIVYSCEHRPG